MMNLVREIRGTLSLNDLLLIMSIAFSIPLRLAVPIAVEIVSRRMNIQVSTLARMTPIFSRHTR
jgi:hypothetical protein